jgi:hypothetical protein
LNIAGNTAKEKITVWQLKRKIKENADTLNKKGHY